VIQINVVRSGLSDFFLTLTDNNTAPPNTLLNSLRVNEGAQQFSLVIQEDGSGKGNIAWTAVSASDPSVSNSGTATPSNNDTIEVGLS
jgi:hypothetical protein